MITHYSSSSKTTKRVYRVLMILVLILIIVILFRLFDVSERIVYLLEWINNLGFIGMFVYFILYVAACVLVIPGSALSLGAGFIYGVAAGAVLVSISSTIGASAAFLLGRYIARSWVEKKTSQNNSFKEIDKSISQTGWKIVLLLRLSPIFPFNALNYVLGITGLKFRDYVTASWIGMMPGTVMYVYIGSLASSLAAIGVDAGRQRSTFEWIIYVVGFIATLAVTILITKMAKKALSEAKEIKKIDLVEVDEEKI